jgi:acyl-CoA reductase-like NAD-dependent aldehyde dehydrogenase
VPDGVVNVVTTQRNVGVVAQQMCEHTAVEKVSFTGSTPTPVTKLLARIAARSLKIYAHNILLPPSRRADRVVRSTGSR